MASGTCWRCLVRPSTDLRLPLALSPRVSTYLASNAASFSTTTTREKGGAKPATPAKGRNVAGSPKKGIRSFVRKKKNVARSSGNPPKPGERRAHRRRIVLSNTSAIEVTGIEEMSTENVKNDAQVGTMVAIPGPLIDQLRATEAFKPTQSWGLFRKPCMLIRKETTQLAKEMESLDKKTIRRVIMGERGSGKSLLVLQAQAMALQRNWIVITIPEAQYVVDGSTDYRPVPNTNPVMYEQREYTARMLQRLVAANPGLAKLKLSHKHNFSTLLSADASILNLAELGAHDFDLAVDVFKAVLKEIYLPGRPSVLLTLDGLSYAMRETQYRAPSFEPIHAHSFNVIQWFMRHLSGEEPLPNGGVVLAATSGSNDPKNETLRFRLHQLEVKQALEKGLPNPAPNAELPHPMLPFLLATGQQPNPVPQPDPYYKYDQNTFKVLGTAFGVAAGNKTADSKEVEVQNVKGLGREEARGLMEYWAQSGMMRQEISERLVGERWTLSGGGVVGELERGCVRFRM